MCLRCHDLTEEKMETCTLGSCMHVSGSEYQQEPLHKNCSWFERSLQSDTYINLPCCKAQQTSILLPHMLLHFSLSNISSLYSTFHLPTENTRGLIKLWRKKSLNTPIALSLCSFFFAPSSVRFVFTSSCPLTPPNSPLVGGYLAWQQLRGFRADW